MSIAEALAITALSSSRQYRGPATAPRNESPRLPGAADSRFSSTVSRLNSLASWNVRTRPVRARRYAGRSVMSAPDTGSARPRPRRCRPAGRAMSTCRPVRPDQPGQCAPANRQGDPGHGVDAAELLADCAACRTMSGAPAAAVPGRAPSSGRRAPGSPFSAGPAGDRPRRWPRLPPSGPGCAGLPGNSITRLRSGRMPCGRSHRNTATSTPIATHCSDGSRFGGRLGFAVGDEPGRFPRSPPARSSRRGGAGVVPGPADDHRCE